MAEYSGRDRTYYRMRTSSRENPPKDSITTALTAQVVLCIILAVCMLLTKKFDNEDYVEIKRQYAVMLSDTAQTAGLAERFSLGDGILGDFFAGLDEFLDRLKPNDEASPIDGENPATAEAEAEPEDEPAEESDALSNVDFDYLKDGTVYAYIAPSGMGGMFPVDAKDTGEMLSPPEGSTLSPVYFSADMKPPVTGVITSGFSYRYHPLTGNSDFHTGIDVAAAAGTPILAALPGTVAETGYSDIYGNYIVLRHSDNLATSYSHCSEIIAGVGMTVRQGERIALVGETGTATGPHLHFSVIVDDEFVDPAWALENHIQLVEK